MPASPTALPLHPDSLIFEATTRCNHACRYCYNVWHDGDYPTGELGTAETQELIRRALDESDCEVFTFSGGEPLLRDDLAELVATASATGVQVNLITNGSLLTEVKAKQLTDAGVRLFEIALPTAEPDVYEALTGSRALPQVTEAIVDAQLAGAQVAVAIVVSRLNVGTLWDTLELAFALGVRGILLNRVNIGGAGIACKDELMPTRDMLQAMLEIANRAAREFELTIACAIPILPCVLDTSPYANVSFSTCPAGSDRTYVTLDPVGNVRVCNHSPEILGNLREQPLATILADPRIGEFFGTVPSKCTGCPHHSRCHSGCRAAALVTYGTLTARDPIVECS